MQKIIYLIIILTLGCKSEENYLDKLFSKIERASPKPIIDKFKYSSLDSILSNLDKYDTIFVESVNIVFSDTLENKKFEKYLVDNNIPKDGLQIKMAFVAAFHNKLNGKAYDINDLIEKMIIYSDSINSIKYNTIITPLH